MAPSRPAVTLHALLHPCLHRGCAAEVSPMSPPWQEGVAVLLRARRASCCSPGLGWVQDRYCGMQRCSSSRHGNAGTQPERTKLMEKKGKRGKKGGKPKRRKGRQVCSNGRLQQEGVTGQESTGMWGGRRRRRRAAFQCSPWDDLWGCDPGCALSYTIGMVPISPHCSCPKSSLQGHSPAGSLRLCCRTSYTGMWRHCSATEPGGALPTLWDRASHQRHP